MLVALLDAGRQIGRFTRVGTELTPVDGECGARGATEEEEGALSEVARGRGLCLIIVQREDRSTLTGRLADDEARRLVLGIEEPAQMLGASSLATGDAEAGFGIGAPIFGDAVAEGSALGPTGFGGEEGLT